MDSASRDFDWLERDAGPLAANAATPEIRREPWETPILVELRMDAEVGAYQGDDPGF